MLQDKKIYPNNTYVYSIYDDISKTKKTYTIEKIGTPNPTIKVETNHE